jgi:hypothetical protein
MTEGPKEKGGLWRQVQLRLVFYTGAECLASSRNRHDRAQLDTFLPPQWSAPATERGRKVVPRSLEKEANAHEVS